MAISRYFGVRAASLVAALALTFAFFQPNSTSAQPGVTLIQQVLNYSRGAASAFGTTTTANPGDIVEYRIAYTASGGAIPNLQISDTINPSQQIYVTCFGQALTCRATGNSAGQEVVTFYTSSVPANHMQFVYFQTRIAPGYTGEIDNTAYATMPGGAIVASSQTAINPGAPIPAAPVPTTTTMTLNKSACYPNTATCSSSMTVPPGATFYYALSFQNTGTVAASNVFIYDTISNGTFTPTGTSSQCTYTAPTVTCNIGTVNPGVSGTVYIAVVAPTTAGSFTNQATLQSSNANPSSSVATVNVVTTPSTTLSLVKSVRDVNNGQSGTNITGSPGDTLVYTLVVQNTGSTNSATGVTITDSLGAGQTYVTSSGPTACAQSGSTVTCTYGTLSPAATATYTIQTTIANPFTGTVTNNASASASNAATVSATQTTVTVGAPPPTATTLSISKLVADTSASTAFSTSTSARPGDIVTYQITVQNTGAAQANGVLVADSIQPGQSFYSGSCFFGPVTCSTSGTTITFFDGNLAPGQFATDQFSVTVNGATYGQVIPNNATASASNAATVTSSTTSVFVQAPPIVTPPPIYVPPTFVPVPQFVTLTICGTVTAFTAPTATIPGIMTISGETFTLVQTATVTGVPVTTGTALCFVVTLNNEGEIASMVATQNLAGASFVCGPISPFTPGFLPYPGFSPYPGYTPTAPTSPYPGYGPFPAPTTYPAGYYGWGGPMMIGGYPFFVAPNTVFPFQLQTGTSFCFLLSTAGAVTGSLSVVPTLAMPYAAPERRHHVGAHWIF